MSVMQRNLYSISHLNVCVISTFEFYSIAHCNYTKFVFSIWQLWIHINCEKSFLHTHFYTHVRSHCFIYSTINLMKRPVNNWLEESSSFFSKYVSLFASGVSIDKCIKISIWEAISRTTRKGYMTLLSSFVSHNKFRGHHKEKTSSLLKK